MKKGIELPINTLIIIVIAILVLITLISLYFSASGSSSSTVSLEAATKATCLKVNPTLCNNGKYNGFQPRATVDNFDANKDGKINDFTPNSGWLTSYCIDDNLETLCGFYYGCDLTTKTFLSVCDYGNPIADFLTTDAEGQEWYECCVKRICGC